MLSRVMVTSYQNAPAASGEAPLENLGLSAQHVKVSIESSAPLGLDVGLGENAGAERADTSGGRVQADPSRCR